MLCLAPCITQRVLQLQRSSSHVFALHAAGVSCSALPDTSHDMRMQCLHAPAHTLRACSLGCLACMLPWADARGRCSLFKSTAFLVATGSARQALHAHELVPATHGWRRAGTACKGSPCFAKWATYQWLPSMRRAPMPHRCGEATRCGAWEPLGRAALLRSPPGGGKLDCTVQPNGPV